jgi:hypothetical protein
MLNHTGLSANAGRNCARIPFSPLPDMSSITSFTNPYQERQFYLSQIGFQSYAEYLNSALWKKIRWEVLCYFNFKCFCCEGRATQVHHQCYHKRDLLGKRRRFLKAICSTCHESLEFTWRSGRKNNLLNANAKLEKLVNDGSMKRARIIAESLDAEFDAIFQK